MSACVLLTSPPADGVHSSRLVYGFVTDSAGAPLAGISVTLEMRSTNGCGAIQDQTGAVTDAAGRYAAWLGRWGDPFDACVRVRANPAPGAAVRGDSSTHNPVRFGFPDDSTRIDLSLPPSL
jgi:hypothetical protein